MSRIRDSGSPFGFFLAVTYFLYCLVAVRAEHFEEFRRAQDLLVDDVYDVLPILDARLVVHLDGLLLALGLALFDTA